MTRRGISPERRHAAVLLCLAALAAPVAAEAQAPSASTDGPTTSSELPALPPAPTIELPKPSQKELQDLDERLRALASPELSAREDAARELLEVDARAVPAIAFRLAAIADRADKEAMKRLFLELRRASKENDADGESEERGKPGAARADYLTLLVSRAKPTERAFPDLIAVVGMSRMLSQIGNVEAVRVLLGVYVRFGEFLRVATQRELATLGDKAVPALLEARRHPAEKVARWASRQLDALGRAVPGEAVRITEPQILADVLRAYGRTRDPDAARIVVSFANSERAVVREAARQSIALMGEVSMWQLRDTYETIVGKKPARDWSWERTARELFAAFDRARSQAVGSDFEAGRVARAKGDLNAMRQAFDRVLADDPRFERRAELAAGYLEFAEYAKEKQPADAEVALLRAERFTSDETAKRRIQGKILALRAASSAARGVADLQLIDRALELDPGNVGARALSTELRVGKPDSSAQRTRQLAAGTIGLTALVSVVLLLRRRREDAEPPLPTSVETAPASAESSPDDSKPK